MLTDIPFSVADQMVIDALPDETRAVVERYVRSRGVRFDGLAREILSAVDGAVHDAVNTALSSRR